MIQEEHDNSERLTDKIEEKTGIEPKDILRSPLEPPKVKDNRPASDRQKNLFLYGLLIILFGLVLIPVGVLAPLIVGIIGVLVLAYSVLVRV